MILPRQRRILMRDRMRIERRPSPAYHITDNSLAFAVANRSGKPIMRATARINEDPVPHILLRWQLKRAPAINGRVDQIVREERL
jgi:hypothetical protein